MKRISPENAEQVMLAARYKNRQNAVSSLQRRWWRYVDINLYAIQMVPGTTPTLWQIVFDTDGAIARRNAKLAVLDEAIRAEKKGPSRKAQTLVNRIFTLNLNKKPPTNNK